MVQMNASIEWTVWKTGLNLVIAYGKPLFQRFLIVTPCFPEEQTFWDPNSWSRP